MSRRLVARVEPPATDYPVFTTYDLDMQFRVMRLVADATDVPVPETHWYEPDPSVLGGAFFVMDRVDGQVPPDVLPYTFGDNWVFDGTEAARRTIQESAVRAMAGIHSITPADHDLVFPGARPARRHRPRAQPQPLEGLPRVGGGGPAGRQLLDDCFAWLTDNLPGRRQPRRPVLGRRSDRQHDVPGQQGGGRSRLGDGGGGTARGRPRVDVLSPPVLPGPGRRSSGAPGLPDMFRPADVRASYAGPPRVTSRGTCSGTSPMRPCGTA